MSPLATVAVFLGLLAAVNGRVYYLDDYADNPRIVDESRPAVDRFEQSSRDLDLTFSAGDPAETVDVIRPRKKVIRLAPIIADNEIYTLGVPEKPSFEINRQTMRPLVYKWTDMPERRNLLEEASFTPDRRRKLVRVNDEDEKGEVIVDLRVIANHNSA